VSNYFVPFVMQHRISARVISTLLGDNPHLSNFSWLASIFYAHNV